MNERLEIEFLGTGTSTGVPALRCPCAVCHSSDERDRRLRASAIVRHRGVNLLIDCGPDFRTQMLRARDDRLDAVLLTHIHYDHVGGIDDLRAYGLFDSFPVYAPARVIANLRERIPYCFGDNLYPGVPHLRFIEVDGPFEVNGVTVTPVPVMHGKMPIVGYRIGPLAYITDAKTIAPDVIDRLHGIDLLVLNALRHTPHHSHLSLSESLDIIKAIAPGRALLTHMCHEIGFHTAVNATLPQGVSLAFDGQTVIV